MFRFTTLLLLPLLLDARSISIASYNVENLFDMQRDGQEYAEYVPGRHGWSEAMLAKKIRNLTEVICDLEADVVGLQEVENDRALVRLQRSLERAGCRYPYRAITRSKQTPIHNALLSKIPITRSRDVRVTRYGRQRSILEVVLDTDPPLRIFNSHWRSKRGPESERIVYAKALKKRLDKLPKGSEYILLGDFNSNYNESRTIDAKHNDTHNRTGVNDILRTIRNGQMVRLNTLHMGEHYSLWMELAAGARWSHNFFGDKEGIDALIIPSALHDGRGWEYQEGSFRVFKPNYLFGKKGQVNRWAYKHHKHLGKGYSDHLPIIATFSTGHGAEGLSSSTGSWWGKLKSWIQQEKTVPAPKSMGLESAVPLLSPALPSGTIQELKTFARLNHPVRLSDVHVIFKRRDSAVIQQDKHAEAILIYRDALQLEEGQRYDIVAYKKKRYKGLDELTDIEVERPLGAFNPVEFLPVFDPEMMHESRCIGCVVRNITGRYGKKTLDVDGVLIPIHFQKRAGRPHHGDQVKIDRAHIGYYKDHVELVVWDKKDYTIVK
jgi:hypothetical protein